MSSAAASAVVAWLSIGSGPRTVVVKDSIDIAGYPTRQGSAAFATAAPAAENAEVIERLLADSEWRLVGKAAMHELAFGMTGINPATGTPINPQWPDRIPGGSSSGSAATVASGIADLSIGTDTGGSIRLPAVCCGVIGFKPSFGTVSRRGVQPPISSLDCVGPLARSMELIERAMSTIAPGFRAVPPPRRLSLAVAAVPATDDVTAAVASALHQIGAATRPALLPSIESAFDAGLVIIGHENWNAFAHLADHPDLGEDVRIRLLRGRSHDTVALAEAERTRTRFRAEVDAILDGVDAIALPALPDVPPTLAEASDPLRLVALSRFLRPFNVSGHPALTLPLRTTGGLPAGLQLVGRRGADAHLCAVAGAIERAMERKQRT